MPPAKKQPQVDPQEAANTAKELVGGFSGVKTFTAATGTVYGIIAEDKGLALAIAPKITATGGFIGIYTRIRVQKQEDWANLEDGGALFGFPEVKEKSSRHASCEAFVAVALHPTTPYAVGKLIEKHGILEGLVGTIAARLGKAGQALIVTPDALVMYLKNVFDTVLPSEEPAGITEFPVCIGDKEIAGHIEALYQKFGPKSKKSKGPSENPPGAEGQNPD